MSYWIAQEEDTHIPIWLKSNMKSTCPYCGGKMMNYYNDDMRCTNRKCSNVECYGLTAAKADFARKLIGIKGVGFANCLKDVELIKATSPFQLFKLWNIKPTVTMEQFLRIHCFEGIDSEWGIITKKYSIYTLDELFDKYDGKWKQLLIDNKDMLYENVKYVTLMERPDSLITEKPSYVFTIMITGTPNGFRTKEDFIDTLNLICKGRIVILHQKTKRQSGVDFLIREPGSTTRGKVDAAKRGGIPIVTSVQFIDFLTEVLRKLNAEVSQ